ncbi:MAG: CRISPR-associated endonuclease Cas2 [Patescibacteria group bacterium]
MKLPITDQFILDILYPFVSIADDAIDFLLSNRYKQINILFGNENPVIGKYRKDKSIRNFNQVIYHLKKNNYIRVKNLEGKKAIMLTKEGFNKALRASFQIQEKKKRKDGKWIMITFDIPQKHQKARNLLRSVLKNLGYKMFQQSVWVTPYDVSDKTERLLQFYSLEKYVKIFIIEKL